MTADPAEEVLASWKRVVDRQFMADGPFRRAQEQSKEKKIRFTVRLLTTADEHDLRAWEDRLIDFLAGYGFDVSCEQGISSLSATYFDDVDLLIVFPLSSDIQSFCVEFAKIPRQASRMLICVPDGDDSKYYCRLVRETYGVETVTLTRGRLVRNEKCRIGVDLAKSCADQMMKRVASAIRQLRIENTIVIMIHGIRTRALWQSEVKRALESSGLVAIPTNYNKFDVVRFLLPFNRTKEAPIRRVQDDIKAVRRRFYDADISILAHSFGTLITGNLLKNADNKFGRIALCGSVLPIDFDFATAEGRFSDIVNEVGCRDLWPAIAAKIGWGYGPTGSFGFNRGSYVHDRKHALYGHSGFLNGTFCRTFWVPFFCDGSRENPGDVTAGPSRCLRIVDNVPAAKLIFWGTLVALLCWGLWAAGRWLGLWLYI